MGDVKQLKFDVAGKQATATLALNETGNAVVKLYGVELPEGVVLSQDTLLDLLHLFQALWGMSVSAEVALAKDNSQG